MTEADWQRFLDSQHPLEIPDGFSLSHRRAGLLVAACVRVFTQRFPCNCCQPLWDIWDPDHAGVDRHSASLAHSSATIRFVDCIQGQLLYNLVLFWDGIIVFNELRNKTIDLVAYAHQKEARARYGPVLHDGGKCLEIVRNQCAFERADLHSAMQSARDIFGNPFRPVPIDRAWLTWRDQTIVKLAQAAYEERALPSGHLDRARLAILADALEEAGCTTDDILAHLRGPGPHVRGCWVVDLLLGKE